MIQYAPPSNIETVIAQLTELVSTYSDGTKVWYKNGELHREDGPAIIYPNGAEFWWRNGKRHRVDGPAVILANEHEYWYVNDEEIDIQQILESLDISPDWRNWSDVEKMIVRLALP